MRLTLRNLLAYMHQVFTPQEQSAFAALLASAPRAQELELRCRRVTRCERLAAPDVDSAGVATAQSVAQYLDFELAEEPVRLLEMSVLESDELLAEIVNCHAVLSEIVARRVTNGKSQSKQRLYALVEQRAASPEPSSSEESNVDLLERLADEVLSDEQEPLSDSTTSDSLYEPSWNGSSQDGAATAVATRPMQELSTATSSERRTRPDPFKVSPYATATQSNASSIDPAQLKLLAAGLATVAVVVWVVWSASGGFFTATKRSLRGPHTFGVAADSNSPTLEVSGTIRYVGSSGITPDAGALILAWPTDSTPKTKLTAAELFEDLNHARMNPKHDGFVVASTDEQGRFKLRLPDSAEIHVVVLSQGLPGSPIVTWNDGLLELGKQVDNPLALIGRRSYTYRKLEANKEKQLGIDHTFEKKAW